MECWINQKFQITNPKHQISGFYVSGVREEKQKNLKPEH